MGADNSSAAPRPSLRLLARNLSNFMTIRVRFAPSPTGHLHVGNVRTALFNWLYARKNGGTFIVRIEDTDLTRSEERFETLIFDDLHWLGLDWQEGPDLGGDFGPYRQSDRIEIYKTKAVELVEAKKAYYCFCSEEELSAQAEQAKLQGIPWKYPGTCLRLSEEQIASSLRAGRPSVIRLKVRHGPIGFRDIVHGAMEFSSDVISDPILLRSTGLPTYNYAVVVDDALMQITHVIRGDDHLSNTPKQVLIYEAFGWPSPAFAHLSTILGEDHTRLSKRHGATSIQNFQDMGILPEALVNYLALLGWSPTEGQSEIIVPEKLVQEFDLERVSKSPAVFDLNKLYWLNRHYLQGCDRRRLLELVEPRLREKGLMPFLGGLDPGWVLDWVSQLIDAILPGVNVLNEVPDRAVQLLYFDALKSLEDPEVQQVLADEGAVAVIREFLTEISLPDRDVVADWKAIVNAVKDRTKRKGKQLFHPIRVALTGSSSGPELDKLVPLFEGGSKLILPNPVQNCLQRTKSVLAALMSIRQQ
jgi:nondiscriminating glutamyl-tRNA synthetase